MDNKEIMRCIRIMSNIAAAYGDAEDQLYIFTECFIQLAQKKGRDDQDIMRKCRAAVACLIGALVPREYFDSFMEDIGLLEDEIYNEVFLQEVQDDGI